MLNVGMGEFLVFVILAIIILGPEKLPFVIQKTRQTYKKTKLLFDSQIYDLESQLDAWQQSSDQQGFVYVYIDPIARYPYHPHYIQSLFLNRHHQLCHIGLIHQLNNHALKHELIASKSENLRAKNITHHKIKVVA